MFNRLAKIQNYNKSFIWDFGTLRTKSLSWLMPETSQMEVHAFGFKFRPSSNMKKEAYNVMLY